MTMKMSFCLKAATTLHDDDLASITDSIEAYVKAGMPVEQAETAAVDDLMAAVQDERAETVAMLREQHPASFKGASKPVEKPEVKAARRQARVPALRGSDALARISAHLGGLSTTLLPDLSSKVTRTRTSKAGKQTQYTTWDNPLHQGHGPLFRAGGTGDLSEVARVLEEEGYIEQGLGERDPVAASQQAEQIVRAELANGGSTLRQGSPAAIEAEMQRRREMADLPDTLFDDFTPEDLAESGYAAADAETKALTEHLLAQAEAQGQDTEAIREDAARGIEDQGGFLAAQTADDLKAKTEREAKAAADEQKTQQDLIAKARADAMRGDFTLTGSDRPADVAAAAGQKDIFDGNLSEAADFEGSQLPEVIPAGPVLEQDTAATAKVEAAFSKFLPGLKLTALPRLTKPTEKDSPLAHQRYATTQLVERLFGKRVIWFSSNVPFANGLQADYVPDAIFISESTTRPLMAVLGHELLHTMRGEQPGLYRALGDRLTGMLVEPGSYGQLLNARRRARGLPELGFDKLREELIADIVGDNFTDPIFWRRMQQGQPGLFQRVLSVIRDFLDRLLSKLKNERPYGTAKYLDDIAGARDAVAQAMREFAESPKTTTDATILGAQSLSQNTDPFYSELARQVEVTPMGGGNAAAWKNFFKGLTNKGSVKADEIAWTGIEDWLDLQTGKVTRAQVLDYLNANGVRVTETVLGEVEKRFDVERMSRSQLIAELDDMRGWSVLEEQPDITDVELREQLLDAAQVAEESMESDDPRSRSTKYSQYTIPGGTNYREVLLTLPVKNDGPPVTMEQLRAGATLPRTVGPEYQSGHWDAPNVLAHIRLNDRTDAEGKRVLFVEEIQSDWAQAGKKKGFSGRNQPLPPHIEVREDAARGEKFPAQRFYLFDTNTKLLVGWSGATAEEAIAKWREANQRREDTLPAAPFVGKTDAWVALAIKRIIKLAADEGYDRVAFVNGDQSAERYDISKHIERIHYEKADDGRYELIAYKTGSRDDSTGSEALHEGEGMKAFYNAIVPKVAKEVLRKVGGGRLINVELQQPGLRAGMRDPETGATLGPDFEQQAGKNLDQPGFDITPEMQEKAAGGLPMFSLKEYDPETKEALRKAGVNTNTRLQNAGAKLRLIYGKMRAALTKDAAHAFRQGYMDQFHGIEMADRSLFGQMHPSQSNYVAARLANGGTSSVMRALMLHGQAKWAANGQHLEKIEGTKGLLDIFAPLGDDLNDFFGWMVGNRAERLMREGRENNFTPEDIQKLKALAVGKEAKFKAAALEYAAFKRSVLDIAQEAGLIDGEGRKVWDQADYIPFYREIDEKAVFSATGKKGLAGQSSGIRVLKGGASAVNDTMENILMNFSRLIDASLKNNAISKTIHSYELEGATHLVQKVGYDMKPAILPREQVAKLLEEAGTPPDLMELIPQDAFDGMAKMWAIKAPEGPDIVRIMVGGKPQFYKVHEPLLLKALTSFVPFDFPGLGVARAFKRVLTATVTATPEFMLRNFIRDSFSTQMISKDGINPLKSLWGIVESYTENGAYETLLFAGSSFQSGNINANDPSGTAVAMRRALRKRGMNAASVSDFMASILDSPAKAWEVYRHFGEAIENSNRDAMFKAAYAAEIKRGNSPAMAETAAAFASKDLMDFTLRGSSPVYQVMADVLPFFNARVQGAYRTGRADPKRLIALGLLMTAATLALALANAGNDDYDALQDWDKDTYWHVWINGLHWRIPKPFELGVVFATIPERIIRYAKGQDTGKKFLSRLYANLHDQLAIDPVPQVARPAIDVIYNHDNFRDRPIENIGDEGKLPSARTSKTTSATTTAVVQAAAPAADFIGLSPKKLEYLVNGYFGSVGGYALGAADIVVRQFNGEPVQPERRLDQYPIVKAFFQQNPPLSTVYESDLYKLRTKVEEVYRTVHAMRKDGQEDQAAVLEAKYEDELNVRKVVAGATKRLAKLNRQRDAIYSDTQMTAHEKRVAIDEILAQKAEVAKEVMKDPEVVKTQ